jgi:hypothetical protein
MIKEGKMKIRSLRKRNLKSYFHRFNQTKFLLLKSKLDSLLPLRIKQKRSSKNRLKQGERISSWDRQEKEKLDNLQEEVGLPEAREQPAKGTHSDYQSWMKKLKLMMKTSRMIMMMNMTTTSEFSVLVVKSYEINIKLDHHSRIYVLDSFPSISYG